MTWRQRTVGRSRWLAGPLLGLGLAGMVGLPARGAAQQPAPAGVSTATTDAQFRDAALAARAAAGADAVALWQDAYGAAQAQGSPESVTYACLGLAGALASAGELDRASDVAQLGLGAGGTSTRLSLLTLAADLGLARDRPQEASALLDEAGTLLEGAEAAARASFHGTRGDLHATLGLTDLAWLDFAEEREVLGPDHARVRWHELRFAAASMDFGGVGRFAQALLDEAGTPAPQRARAGFWRAMARARQRVQPNLAQRELAAAAADDGLDADARCYARAQLALLQIEAAELERARRVLAAIDPEREAGLSLPTKINVEVARAKLALHAAGARIDLEARRDALVALFEESLQRWRAVPPRAGGVGFLQLVERRDLLGALAALRLRLAPDAGPRAVLRDLLRVQACGSLARTLALPTGSVDAVVAELLPRDGGILVYQPSVVQSHVVVVTSDGVECVELGSDAQLLRQVGELRALLGDRASEPLQIRRAAERVAAWALPEPVRAKVRRWRALTVVGRRLLGGLPFEALPGEAEPWLGMELAIADLPSLPVGLWLAQRDDQWDGQRGAAAEPRADVGVVVASSPTDAARARWALPELPITASTVDGLLQPFAHPHPDRPRGSAATAGALARVAEQLSGALVLFAHGVYAPSRERPAGAALAPGDSAPDGVLWCDQAETIRFPPFVFLGVCGGSRATLRRGDDDSNHLGGAALRGGARAVAVADATLAVWATVALADAMLAEIAAGSAPAEALRVARCAVAASAPPGRRHPYDHAQLRLVGLGHRPLAVQPAPPGWPWVWWGLGAAVLSLLGWLGWRRRAVSR
ncbi:MAG: CHAT domain-containing protein [Planctomycetota bacterium]